MGYALSLFIIAVKMDFKIIFRTGKRAYMIGILSLVIPMLITLGFLQLFYQDRKGQDLFINASTVPLTHFPVVACLLSDLNLLNSELGRLALSSSLIANIVAICLTMFLKVYIGNGQQKLLQILGPIGLVLAGVLAFRPLMRWMIKNTPKGRPVKGSYVLIVFLLTLFGALVTDYSQQFVLLGFFVMGVTVPDGPPLGSALVDKFDSLISGMLLPFFITSSVMNADMSDIDKGRNDWKSHIVLALLAFLSKVVVCLLWALFDEMAVTDALALGFIMSAKGIVDIGSITLFREAGELEDPSFSILMLWIILVASAVPVIVKHLYHPLRKYAGYQRRDVMHCKHNADLRILACICRPDNVAAVTNLLRICCATKESPISTFALHLVKLVGRSQPVFISHELHKDKPSSSSSSSSYSYSYSEDVVWAFDRFERNSNKDAISARVYTAISPSNSMHEDICTLALDKLCSLIILPFHRKLRLDGSVDSEDHELRALNKSVLERAPCSVGVLIDRAHIGESSSSSSSTSCCNSSSMYTMPTMTSISVAAAAGQCSSTTTALVAVIFIGGRDDIEALALAKRMARGGSRIKVDVVKLTFVGDGKGHLNSVDSSFLTDIQSNNVYNQQFTLMEKAVKDGAESAIFLKSVMGLYDLIIVGRRYHVDCKQVEGLKEWSEIEELGVFGDLLASTDLKCRTSVLVVQHQQHWRLKGN
ncbi:hypothetical protein Dimus_009051 [Dionaea muscipula]